MISNSLNFISQRSSDGYQWMKDSLYNLSLPVYRAGRPVFDGIYAIYNFIHPINAITEKREWWYLPTFVEKVMGELLYPGTCNAQGGRYEDEELQKHIEEMVQNISSKAQRPGQQFDYKVNVLDSQVMNAFAMPGGKLAIHYGMIKKIKKVDLSAFPGLTHDDVVAAVLGHEVAHAAIGHSRKRLEKTFLVQIMVSVSSIASTIFINQKEKAAKGENEEAGQQNRQRFQLYRRITKAFFDYVVKNGVDLMALMDSRGAEYEADKYGIKLAYEAGYDVRGALALQKLFMSKKVHSHPSLSWIGRINELLSTHPDSTKRLEANQTTIDELCKEGSFKKTS